MNFATLAYAGFLVVVVTVHWVIPRPARRYWLIGTSLIFYGSWNPIYVPGFAALVIANWSLGLLAARRPRLGISFAVILNLGILGFFKYADWLMGSGSAFLAWVTGQQSSFAPMGIILPLAVSFVTFTMLAYVIDIGRGGHAEPHLGRFALFVTFFPHLISGPIMRAHELLPQVRHPRPFRADYAREALPMLVGGLLKKTIADNLAPAVGAVFSNPGAYSAGSIWIAILAFAFEIYFDFAGYTDMALGSALLLGFRLPQNFDWPYRSLSLQEFWRRWHMTLSRWLRDYLYIPLGGSRHGRVRTYLSLAMTMLLGGLWHGAGITFILWGAWHGVGLAAHRWQRFSEHPLRLSPAVAWGMTFVFVLLGWVLFRAPNLGSALTIYARAFSFAGGARVATTVALTCVVLLAAQWPGWTTALGHLAPSGSYRRYALYGAGLLVAVVLLPVHSVQFIYFQF